MEPLIFPYEYKSDLGVNGVHVLFFSRRKLGLLALLLCAMSGLFLYAQHSLATPSLVRAPGTYYMIHTQEKVVALTFDDGPDPMDTPSVLDILKEKHARATFFVLGEAARTNPQLLKRMISEGHEIGNHSFSHDYRQKHLVDELNQTDEAVFAATGTHTTFYRPPGGILSKGQLETIKSNGHIVTLWSVDSKDWLNPGEKRIISNVVRNVFPGSIVLMHDGGYHRVQTVKALAQVIDALQVQGYRFVTLSELRTLDLDIK